MFLKTFSFLTLIYVVNSKQDFSKRVTNFSFELLYYTGLETDGHTVISPYGIWTLMAALAQGTEDQSYDQLRKALKLPKGRKELLNGLKLLTREVRTKSKGVELADTNFMFTDLSFRVNPEFQKSVKSGFDANLVPLDFTNANAAANNVNNLIARATKHHIEEAVTSDDFTDARMILTNVIYFKGLWNTPFNTSNTKVESFFDENGRAIGQVNMMYQRAPLPFANIKSLSSFVLEVPYGEDNRFEMLIILPYAGMPLLEVFKNFQKVDLNEIYTNLDKNVDEFGLEDVDFWLPRFKISTNVVLNKPLNYMGVFDIFEPDLATFIYLTNEPVYVSKVVHKADIEVTESGTVAAAVTSSVISNRNTPVDFKVNRPFIYLIVEKMSSTVLFGGIYSKPTVF